MVSLTILIKKLNSHARSKAAPVQTRRRHKSCERLAIFLSRRRLPCHQSLTMLVEVHEAFGHSQHDTGLLLTDLIAFALGNLRCLLEMRRCLIHSAIHSIDLSQSVMSIVCDSLQRLMSKLVV